MENAKFMPVVPHVVRFSLFDPRLFVCAIIDLYIIDP